MSIVEDSETVRYYLNIVAEEDAHAEAIAALERIEEQLEAERAENARLRSEDRNFKATVDALSEAVAARDEQVAIARDMCARPTGTCFAALTKTAHS